MILNGNCLGRPTCGFCKTSTLGYYTQIGTRPLPASLTMQKNGLQHSPTASLSRPPTTFNWTLAASHCLPITISWANGGGANVLSMQGEMLKQEPTFSTSLMNGLTLSWDLLGQKYFHNYTESIYLFHCVGIISTMVMANERSAIREMQIKMTMNHQFTRPRRAVLTKTLELVNPHSLQVGMQTAAATLENGPEVPQIRVTI